MATADAKTKKGVTRISDSLLLVVLVVGFATLFFAAMTWFMRGLHE